MLTLQTEMSSEVFECPICNLVMEVVAETPCCNKLYCRSCIDVWIKKSPSCPECRAEIKSSDSLKSNLPIQRIIDSMPSSCVYENRGCSSKITRGTSKEHLDKCDWSDAHCPYGHEDCPTMLKSELEKHKLICPHKPVHCEQCNELSTFGTLQQHKDEFCTETPVTCGDCHHNFPRKDTATHPQVCVERMVTCSFSNRGCSHTCKARELRDHMVNSVQSHLDLVCKILEQSELQNTQLQTKVTNLTTEVEQYQGMIKELKTELPHALYGKLPFLFPSCMVIDNTPDYVSIEGMVVKSEKLLINKVTPCQVRANFPVPQFNGLYYFEVNIVQSKENAIGIGFCIEGHDLTGMPGWLKGYGYHGDDGRKFSDETRGQGKSYGPVFGMNDIVGCGYDQKRDVIFFTKNGASCGTAFRGVPKAKKLYPVVGIQASGVKLVVNFGQIPFKYKVPL